MCDPVSLTLAAVGTGVGMSVLQDKQNKKDKINANFFIDTTFIAILWKKNQINYEIK